ncbi:MAG: DUF4249 domain-containing protein [Cyclobacteriaceae bacterium]|nr:DUF4249 domain-containing protein [Cyclobacteriaceae bacterium]
MKTLSQLIIVSVIITMAGCIPDPLEVGDIPSLKPVLVISSQVMPGQRLSVLVTKSIGALDAGRGSDLQALMSQVAVMDAVVTIEFDNTRDTLVHQGYGVYLGSANVIESGKDYFLRVNSISMGEATSTARAPRQVPFQSVDAELFLTGFDSLASITYSFVDPPEQNWYMINVQKFSAEDEVNDYLNPRVFTRLVSDEAFNGNPFEEQFNVIFQNFTQGDSIGVFFSSISKDYFDYLSLRNDSRYNLGGFATEPLNFPTNVKGGYGYFNLHVPDIRTFELE